MSRPASDTGRGRLFVITAPSGAGKTTLVHALVKSMPNLRFSVSYTTRPPRPTEVDGKDYFFVSDDQFRQMLEDDAFLEHARVFDHWYGTGKAHVADMLGQGYSVLLEIDWQGAIQVRRAAPEASSIFILPPSVPELEHRLRGRGTDSEETIARRLRDSLSDMSHWDEFDYVIVNDDLNEATKALASVVAGGGPENRADLPALKARIARILPR